MCRQDVEDVHLAGRGHRVGLDIIVSLSQEDPNVASGDGEPKACAPVPNMFRGMCPENNMPVPVPVYLHSNHCLAFIG